jgi:hypothetical protein
MNPFAFLLIRHHQESTAGMLYVEALVGVAGARRVVNTAFVGLGGDSFRTGKGHLLIGEVKESWGLMVACLSGLGHLVSSYQTNC